MGGLNLWLVLALGLAGLSLHWLAVALAQALRAYSRSRLEEVCQANGRAERADQIAHDDEATEQAAGAVSVACALLLAALLGAIVDDLSPGLTFEIVLAISLGVAAVGYLVAGVVGRVFAESLLDLLWPVASALRVLAFPLTQIAAGIETLAYSLSGTPDAPHRPASVEVEIHSASDDETDVEADLPESTREMLERVVELSRRDVSEIMTPRTAMVALQADVPAREAARIFHETGRSRIPLFGENRDDIVGILYAKDLFARMTEDDPKNVAPRTLARTAYCVPETKSADELLNEFRSQRTQIAIVLDEYGGVAGLVTLEDVLEELVGTIDDEHDIPTPDDPVVELGKAVFEVHATLSLEDLNDRLGLRLPENGDIQTIGGFVFNALGRLPEQGETFRAEGITFTIVEVVDHSIRRLRLDLQPTPVTTEG